MRHFDEQILALDERRITQQTTVVEGADDAATIQNLLTSINNLYSILNASDLTEE
jgi:hypothetical protein